MQITSGCSQVIAYLWAVRACGPLCPLGFPLTPLPPLLSSPLRFLAPSSTFALLGIVTKTKPRPFFFVPLTFLHLSKLHIRYCTLLPYII